jgi:hypothetical protein
MRSDKRAWTSGWPTFSMTRGRDRTILSPDPTRCCVWRSSLARGWAVEFLINDGDGQVELKGFLSL